MNNDMTKKIITGAIILACVIAFIFAINIGNALNDSNVKQAETANKEDAKPTAYDLRVSRGLYGIKITNNENVDLKDCTIKINNKYSTTATLIAGVQKEIVWTEFTDNALKFDIDNYAVESVYVADCNSDNRLSSFDFPKS